MIHYVSFGSELHNDYILGYCAITLILVTVVNYSNNHAIIKKMLPLLPLLITTMKEHNYEPLHGILWQVGTPDAPAWLSVQSPTEAPGWGAVG